MNQRHRLIVASVLTGTCLLAAGCKGPLARSMEQQLRERLAASQIAYRDAVESAPVIELTRPESDVKAYLENFTFPDGVFGEQTNSLIEAERTSGPASYSKAKLILGPDLTGRGASADLMHDRAELIIDAEEIIQDARTRVGEIVARTLDPQTRQKVRDLTEQEKQQIDQIGQEAIKKIEAIYDQVDQIDAKIDAQQTTTVGMTLQAAIALAVRNNLDIRLAQLIPAITDTQVTQAEAVFDAVLFATFNFQDQDTPQPPALAGLDVFGSVQQDTRGFRTGIRKIISSGGQVELATQFNRQFREPSFFADPTFYDANILLSITQPLLRNFGADVVRSQIMLSKNARDEAVEDLRGTMLEIISRTEQTYWLLAFSQRQLMIQTRLYARTKQLREIVRNRLELDATTDAYADALSREELRRADMIRAQQNVRAASDALKQLIYAENLPLSAETVVIPLDAPADLPLEFSLADAVTTSLQRRPEMRRALLEINDATIRQRVADNQRLPQLDLTFSVQYNAVSTGSIGSAYDNVIDGDFIDYVLGLNFEVPIGNRGPEALYEQRKIERRASVVNYQRQAQQVVREVKDATRELGTAYELIGATRAARRAASDRLRVLVNQDDLRAGAVDLRLRAQEILANAEVQEFQAISDYNSAIARYYRAIGTLLQRNGIDFEDPLNPAYD